MRPNIIYILADDMGFGDMGTNNPKSKIPTPHLDRLAAEGMRFTNSHAGSAVCTPSRYYILTGRYAWRSDLKRGIVWEWDRPVIRPDERTVAHLLKDAGYHTAALGKWHLGWDWTMTDGRRPNDVVAFGERDQEKRYAMSAMIDYDARISGGPTERGFDSYFGVDVPNFPPYTWFIDDRLASRPTVPKPDDIYGDPGLAETDWRHEPLIPEFTRRAVDLIERHADSDTPFFLYFPLTSPHSPIVPNEPFKGSSGAGNYGDFVCEVDWVVGQMIDVLARTGQADDTLLIFTSDNGPESRTPDDIGAYERMREFDHYSSAGLRGIKLDAWEGGHRTPFVARWPSVIPAGRVCEQLTTLGDFTATCADILGVSLPPGDAEDSVSILPLLRGGAERPVRRFAIHQSGSGRFAIRRGNWVFIDAPTGGDKIEPGWYRAQRGYEEHDEPGELFDLADDLGERRNLYANRPDLVAELSRVLAQTREHRHPDADRPDQAEAAFSE